jgi:hypothetical protein
MLGAAIRWEDRVQDMLNIAVAQDKRDSFGDRTACNFSIESGQMHCVDKRQLMITKQIERKMYPCDFAGKIIRRLGTQPEDCRSQLCKFVVMIAK